MGEERDEEFVLVKEAPGGAEVWRSTGVRRYFGLPAAILLGIIDLFLSPFKYTKEHIPNEIRHEEMGETYQVRTYPRARGVAFRRVDREE